MAVPLIGRVLRCSERGASIVELAIILPFFMCLALGTLTFANAYTESMSMEDAVRDGARFGTTMATFDADIVKQRVVGLSAGELSAAQVCVALVTVPDATSACGVADPAGADGDDVVKVSATKDTRIEAFFFSRTLTLRAESAGTYER